MTVTPEQRTCGLCRTYLLYAALAHHNGAAWIVYLCGQCDAWTPPTQTAGE